MRFSLSWLRDFLHTEADLDTLARTMTMTGLEVENIEDPAARLSAFTVAQIREVVPHPNADRLSLCEVDTVDGVKAILCGAPNVRAGLRVVYAPLGAFIPGLDSRLSRKPKVIRGVESHGMICSALELCLGTEHDGIIEIASEHDVGLAAAKALGADDPVIEIEVTPNRPDLLGVMGIARDLAAAGMGSFRNDPPPPIAATQPCPVAIDVQTPAMCPAFAGRLIRDVHNRPSPDWLAARLRAAGSTPRNMLVDVTNYLGHERARPLHVYDADKICGTVTARAGRGESFIALDGQEYHVTSDMCAIADESGVIGLGGVMGGLRTGVSEDTRNVLIESAWFEPDVSARTGRALAIDSEARRRFERGVDPQSLHDGLDRASDMILRVCGGEASATCLAGTPPSGESAIRFRPTDVRRLCGVSIANDRMETILSRLGVRIEAKETDVWPVTSPSWRPDLSLSADLVEEIIRIEGFDTIIASAPHVSLRPPAMPINRTRQTIARRVMSARGFIEAVSWSFMDADKASLFSPSLHPGCAVTNPTAGLSHMRPTILANLAEAALRNANHGETEIRLFEAGPIYPSPQKQETVIAALGRPRPPRHWAGPAPAYDAFAVKADLYALFAALDMEPSRMRLDAAGPHWHPGRSARLCLGPLPIAEFGQLHPLVLGELGIDEPLWGLEMTLSGLPASRSPARRQVEPQRQVEPHRQVRPHRQVKPHRQVEQRLTPIIRDFAFDVSEDVAAGQLVRCAASVDRERIRRVHVFDVYRDDRLGDGRKSIAIEVTILPGRTALTDSDIEALCTQVIDKVTQTMDAQLRR